MLYSEQEVAEHRFIFNILVVRTIDFDLFDGGLNDFRIIADRFDKEEFVAHLLYDDLVDYPPPVAGRIGRVEDLIQRSKQ